MPRTLTIGAMNQWVEWQRNAVTTASITALTATGGTATATTAAAHGFTTGDEVEIAGALEPEYNGRVFVEVIDPTHFSYAVVLDAAPAASGTITASVGGGEGPRWTTQMTLAAEVIAASGYERIEAQAVQASTLYRVRLWRVDVSPADRFLWNGVALQVTAVLQLPGTGFIECDCTTEAD